MKKLLETLYVTTPDSYLFCRNENICVKIGGEEKASVPAVMLDGIVCFGEMTATTRRELLTARFVAPRGGA